MKYLTVYACTTNYDEEKICAREAVKNLMSFSKFSLTAKILKFPFN